MEFSNVTYLPSSDEQLYDYPILQTAGRAAAAANPGPAEERTAEWKDAVEYLLGKPWEERTATEKAIVEGFARKHKEGTLQQQL